MPGCATTRYETLKQLAKITPEIESGSLTAHLWEVEINYVHIGKDTKVEVKLSHPVRSVKYP